MNLQAYAPARLQRTSGPYQSPLHLQYANQWLCVGAPAQAPPSYWLRHHQSLGMPASLGIPTSLGSPASLSMPTGRG
jgi:hypothetical protein